jgi:SAM-dependent methyltransferase
MPRQAWTVFRAWVFFSGIAAWIFAIVLAFRGELRWAVVCVVVALGADMAGRLWSRKSPIPMPYFMRWVLLIPRGPLSPKHLTRMLQPRSGERILEIGPGIGVHALPVALSLAPGGVLEVLDVQHEMLDALMERATKARIQNIVATQGDAQKLPYPDNIFDAAYLIGVLGEIPDQHVALHELRRVLKLNGRLVIGDVIIDPDFVSFPALQERTKRAGFTFERRQEPLFSYFACFRPCEMLLVAT